ncbi:MAG: hypothetical protein NTNFB02_06400 [Nitrospira sp.]
MAAKTISKARFDALTFSKSPGVEFFVEEKEWYADQDKNVLGVLTWDKHDHDWGWVILGRDERALFRAIDQDVSCPSAEVARNELHLKLSRYSITGEKVFSQGDRVIKKKFELFRQVVPPEKLDGGFRNLAEGRGFSSAREIMAEIAYSFEDPDGNYVQQFQTSAFDARLWELFLYAFLHENKFLIDRGFSAPDYLCEKYDQTVFVEAVTVNPSQGDGAIQASPETEADHAKLADYAAIKFGSALFSKLARPKRYWELQHVKGKPLIFAIADFHQPHSMVWTHPFIWQYLYGIRAETKEGGDGGEVIHRSIDWHEFGEKRIPSGFFRQPECENVSAVLFSNSGTISKFNRMGKLAGFGDSGVKMVRIGKCYDHDEKSLVPRNFTLYIEAGKCTEAWSEGVSIFHNPNAKYSLDADLFPTVGHHYLKDGKIDSYLPDFFPLASVTQIITIQD